MKTTGRTTLLLALLMMLVACGDSDEAQQLPTVSTLDLTVTGANVQAPHGNVYLFYAADVNFDYATGREADRTILPDGTKAPLVDVSNTYAPTVSYERGGRTVELHPVSAYGTQRDGQLDNHSSVRYSQMHFDVASLSKAYGQVGYGSTVLVVIVLNDEQSRTWVARALQLRSNHLIHIALPDHKSPTYVPASELSVKWWQVEDE